MEEAPVSGIQFLKPGEYPAILLYLVDEALHRMPFPVQMIVIKMPLSDTLPGWKRSFLPLP